MRCTSCYTFFHCYIQFSLDSRQFHAIIPFSRCFFLFFTCSLYIFCIFIKHYPFHADFCHFSHSIVTFFTTFSIISLHFHILSTTFHISRMVLTISCQFLPLFPFNCHIFHNLFDHLSTFSHFINDFSYFSHGFDHFLPIFATFPIQLSLFSQAFRSFIYIFTFYQRLFIFLAWF
jgi:hypothetical protein